MTQTTNEPLSGVDLAVAVAETFGWRTTMVDDFSENRKVLMVNKKDRNGFSVWEPWRDPRAWWKIVEKMALSGYAFCLHNQDDNDMWDAAFVDEHGGIHATAQTPGEAVMLAALQAVRAQG